MCKEYRLVFENGSEEIHPRNRFLVVDRGGLVSVRPVRDMRIGDRLERYGDLISLHRIEGVENCYGAWL